MAKKSPEKVSFIEKFTPVLLIATIVLAFLIGFMWQKISVLPKTPQAIATPVITLGIKMTEENIKKVPVVTAADHIRGSKDAEIIIIEYSDLQCPYCQDFHPILNRAYEEYEGKIAWVYRHFPLTLKHPRAVPAAKASECVTSLVGKDAFWKFTDTIFSNQEKYLTDEGLVEAAIAAGAKEPTFVKCYESDKFNSLIDSSYNNGVTGGVTGTPGTFILNKKGEMWTYSAAVGFESLKATIEEALKN